MIHSHIMVSNQWGAGRIPMARYSHMSIFCWYQRLSPCIHQTQFHSLKTPCNSINCCATQHHTLQSLGSTSASTTSHTPPYDNMRFISLTHYLLCLTVPPPNPPPPQPCSITLPLQKLESSLPLPFAWPPSRTQITQHLTKTLAGISPITHHWATLVITLNQILPSTPPPSSSPTYPPSPSAHNTKTSSPLLQHTSRAPNSPPHPSLHRTDDTLPTFQHRAQVQGYLR